MRHTLKIALLILIFCCAAIGYAAEKPSEYQIKAAYLYNFAKFVRWPESAFSDQKAPLVIGVLGKNHFDGELTPLSLKTVRGRSIEIRYFETLQEIETCHMLYISTDEFKKRESILRGLITRPIVTVGESEQFADTGGIIQFVTIRNRLRFIINLNAARKHKIKIDAQLLSLATDVLEADR